MKKITRQTFGLFAALFLCYAFNYAAFAQKLPTVQLTGMRAPDNAKIDGNPTEWGKLQAYNNATDIFYTLANDDENLYLIVQATDPDIINRVVGGGITLGIQKSGKKIDKNIISITYPVTDNNSALIFNLRGRKGVVQDTSARAADSVMKRNNRTLAQKSKWIRTIGINGLDSLISVYNEDGIKGVGLFDIKKVYTIEMSIALKYLGLMPTGIAKFTYQIKVNGMKNMFGGMTFNPAAGSTPEQIARGERMVAQMSERIEAQSVPTDFWGEYTLAKKN